MTVVPTPAPERPPAPVSQRHAAAFAELKAMETTYQQVAEENADLRRKLDAALNKAELLQNALDDERQHSRIYQRKLIRLAAAMSGIGALCADAEQIMRDAKEVTEAQEETAAEQMARIEQGA